MEYTRVTRALRRRLNSVEPDGTERPNTPQTDLEVISESVYSTPARRTRKNSRDVATPILMPATTPGRRLTRRSSIGGEASPAIFNSPMRRTVRRLNSEEVAETTEITKAKIIVTETVAEEDESENNKGNRRRVTRSSSNSPQDVEDNKTKIRGRPKKNITHREQTPGKSLEHIEDSDDMISNKIETINKSKSSKSPNNSKDIKEQSTENTTINKDQSIDRGKIKKNLTIDQSLEERQRMKSVTFNDSDDNLISPKKFPKTPINSKSKSFIDGTNLESSNENSEHSFQHLNNSKNEKNISKQQNNDSKSIDNSTKDIQNEKSNSILNMKGLHIDTPYKELKLKKSSISSSTPINVRDVEELDSKLKKLKPIVRLAKNYNSLIEKSKDKSNLVSTKFSASWDQAIRGNNKQKIDELSSDKIEESIKINESKEKAKKTKNISSDEEEEDENLEKSEFIDDEAKEVDSEDTIDEEEKKYLEDNKIPEQGESLGSEDTDYNSEENEDKAEEDENDSFVVSDQTDDKLLSTDSEEELIEKKKKYKRIRITNSDDETPEKSVIQKNNRSFTIDKDISIITISTDCDDVFSSGNKSLVNERDANDSQHDKKNSSANRLKRISLNKEIKQNTSIRKNLNTSQISGVEIFTMTEDEVNETDQNTIETFEKDQILSKTVSKSPKSMNSSINISKPENSKSFMKSFESFIKNKNSPDVKDNASKDSKITNKNSSKSPKDKNSLSEQSLVVAESDDDIPEKKIVLNKSLKSPKNKNTSFSANKIFLHKDSEEENRKIDEIQNKSLLKSPRNKNSSINKELNNVDVSEKSNDSEEEIEISLKQIEESSDESKHEEQIKNQSLLKSPKKLNISQQKLNNSVNQSNEEESYVNKINNSETEENFEKLTTDNNEDEEENNDSSDVPDDGKQYTNISFKVLDIKSSNNINSSIYEENKSNNSDEEIEIQTHSYFKSPINANFSRNESMNINRTEAIEDTNENQITNKSLLKSPKNLNDSIRKSINISIKCNQISKQSSVLNDSNKIEENCENFTNDSDDENDKDYVPENEQTESNSSTNSEDAEELKVELEKINQEKNIPKTTLSYSFTTVREQRPSKLNTNMSTSYTTENLRYSDDSSVSDTAENNIEGTKISENVLSEAEDLEKLQSNDFKLKTSKRKSMTEVDRNLDKSTKKSRHSLESTYVNVDEELFNDLRRKLNKTDNTTKSSSIEKHNEDEEQQNNLVLNKSLNVTNKPKTTVTDGNFSNVAHILNRCDEILEAANKAKRLVKLQNKLNNNNKSKKMKTNKRKFKDSTDGSDSSDQILQIKRKSEEPAIAKDVEKIIQEKKTEDNSDSANEIKSKEEMIDEVLQNNRDITKQKKNIQKNLEQFNANKSRFLPTEILKAIGKDPKKDHVKDYQLKYQSESSEMSDIENKSKSANKLKRKALSTEISAKTSKQKTKIISNPSGVFVVEPITPIKNKKRNIISEQELSSGIVYEEPITPESKKFINGFKERHATPKPIGFKVRSILSAGQKEPPAMNLDKNFQKRKRKIIPEPIRTLPKPKWTSSGEFTVEKLEEKINFDESISTDFYVIPLEIKKSSKLVKIQNSFGINNKALEFKKNAIMNSKVHRETSKEMLQRKERQNVYNKF